MPWQRFEARKSNDETRFIVTLVVPQGEHEGAHLSFNRPIREQLLRGRRWVDVFFDPVRQCVGFRFLQAPADVNTFPIHFYDANREHPSSVLISAEGMLRRWGLLDRLRERSFRSVALSIGMATLSRMNLSFEKGATR